MTPITAISCDKFNRYADAIHGDRLIRSEASIAPKERMKLPCLDGFATLYDHPFIAHDGIRTLVRGCFDSSLHGGKLVRFQLQHEAANVVATTETGLSLIDDPQGVAFRLRIPNTMLGQIVARMVDKRSRVGMSIGYQVTEDEVHPVAGHQVRFILKAELSEISLVKAGAVAHAFADLVDGAVVSAPRAGNMSEEFKLASSFHKLAMTIGGVKAQLDKFADRLDVDSVHAS